MEFIPPLPRLRSELNKKYQIGNGIKVHVIYERAWWREKGYSGQMVSDIGPLGYVIDEGYPDEWNISKNGEGLREGGLMAPGLVGFIVAKFAVTWSEVSQEERKNAIIQQLVTLFGSEEAKDIIGYGEFDWGLEKYSGGCPASYLPPGTSQYTKNYRDPFGNVHWAATEMATTWTGYLDGAIQSGQRSAQEILHKI